METSAVGKNQPAVDSAGNRLGVTQRQETLAQLVAQYPEAAITGELLEQLYLSIPGTQASGSSARELARRYLADPAVQRRVELYRKVYGTSRERLLAEREEITDEMLKRWKDRPEGAVRASEALQALRDRETAYGVGRGGGEMAILINANGRVSEALKALDDANK